MNYYTSNKALKKVVKDWQGCTKCPLHATRHEIVFYRGETPCDVLFLGEAPGKCITGDTLIETAWRDKSKQPYGVSIKSLVGKSNFQVYSYDVKKGQLTLGTVKKVWKTGVRKVYKVSYFWWGAKPSGGGGRHKYFGSIKVTDNHPFLLLDGNYKSLSQGLSPGDRLLPFYRHNNEYSFVGTSYQSMTKDSRFLMEHKIGRKLKKGEEVHHESRNKLNDTPKQIVLITQEDHARLHAFEDNPMAVDAHRETHRKVMSSSGYKQNMSNVMKSVLASPEARKKRSEQNKKVAHKTSATLKDKFANDPCYYYRYLLGRRFRDGSGYSKEHLERRFKNKFPNTEYPPRDNHVIYLIEPCGSEAVYDMEVTPHHNFAANGIFVHNSEDLYGEPFIGPAGNLLDQWIEDAHEELKVTITLPDGDNVVPDDLFFAKHEPFTFGITNVIACKPTDDKGKIRPPSKEEAAACSRRLIDTISAANPKLIILLGQVAKKYHKIPAHLANVPVVELQHPAYVLRQGGIGCYAYDSNLLKLVEALEKHLYGQKEKVVCNKKQSTSGKKKAGRKINKVSDQAVKVRIDQTGARKPRKERNQVRKRT